MSLAFRHAFVLLSPGPGVPKASRTEGTIAAGFVVYSDREITAAELKAMNDLAASYQHALEYTYEVHEVHLDVDGPWLPNLAKAMEETMKEALGIVPGVVPDYNDARVNELERSIRNQGRKIDALQAGIDALVAALGTRPQPTAPTAPTQRTHVPEPEPTAITPNMQAAMGKGFPLVGTPMPLGGADPTMPTNPNARGSGRTPEMASGVMGTIGPSPTSRVLSYSGRVDAKGEPVFDQQELPRVGNTLRAGTSVSDIEVPK